MSNLTIEKYCALYKNEKFEYCKLTHINVFIFIYILQIIHIFSNKLFYVWLWSLYVDYNIIKYSRPLVTIYL